MRKIDSTTIRKIYVIGIVICFPLIFLSVGSPWASWIKTGHNYHFYDIYGYKVFTYGGWISLLFIIISLGYSIGYNFKKTITTNIFGCICMGINILIWTLIAPTLDAPYDFAGFGSGYYLGIVMVVILSLDALFLYEHRKDFETEKIVAAETKQVLENIEKEDKKYCPSCGTEIIDKTSTFCNKCGSPLKPQ